jgi:hypothetical protein
MADQQNSQKSVLFLGSGATVGSGIKKNGKKLPSDGEFFSESKGLDKILPGWKKKYPTLNLVREQGIVSETGLFKTWNELFIYRSFARAGIIREEKNTLDKFMNLAHHPWSDSESWRKKHYRWQFHIRRSDWPREYYLAELAIWDLRVLVKEVYSNLKPQNEIYIKFWNGLKTKYGEICAVVNLNYDTTFDKAIGNSDFYYPGCKKSSENKWPLIRPHGSLDWTSQNKFSKPHLDWNCRWTETCNNTPLKKVGYRSDKNNSDLLDFHQPLIVPPAMFKEEVVGTSTTPGLINGVLWHQWKQMEEALRECDHWIFVGISFASGDDHLLALLKRYYKDTNNEKKKICCSLYNCDKTPVEKLEKAGIKKEAICKHHIDEGECVDTFNDKKCVHSLNYEN